MKMRLTQSVGTTSVPTSPPKDKTAPVKYILSDAPPTSSSNNSQTTTPKVNNPRRSSEHEAKKPKPKLAISFGGKK